MADLESGDEQESEFTFDVVISIPEWVEKSVVEQRARQSLGAPPEVLNSIMQSLATHRVVKVKNDVPREKAEKTARRFESVGFRAEITHSLKLKKLSQTVSDGRVVCPACDNKVKPSAETQCPSCGVYIKNLTPEFLERKRIMKKELERAEFELRDQRRKEDEARRMEFEKKVRAEVRAELERKYKGQKQGLLGKFPPGVTLLLGAPAQVVAFVGGRFLLPGQNKQAPVVTAGVVDKEDDIEKVIRQTNQLQADMSKLSSPGNPDAADAKPLIDPKDSLATVASSAPAGSPLSEESKREVANQLILVLAEIGQIERARDMLEKAVASRKTGADLALSSQLRTVQLQVEAWALVHGRSDKPQEQIDALAKMVADLPDAGERTVAAATIGAILLHRPDLLPQAADGLFALADESYKAQKVRDPRVGHELLVARGRGLLNSAQTRIERGLRQQAVNLTGQLDTMTRIAPEGSAPVLLGFNQQVSLMMGNAAGARASLETALNKAAKLTPPQQAAALRALAEGDGVYQDTTLQNTLSALIATAEKRGGPEYAQVLFEVGMMHARNGNEVALKLVQQKMQDATKGTPELAQYDEKLRGLAEVALAWKARKAGNPAGVELHLRLAASLVSGVLDAPARSKAANAANTASGSEDAAAPPPSAPPPAASSN